MVQGVGWTPGGSREVVSAGDLLKAVTVKDILCSIINDIPILQYFKKY